MQFFFVVGVRRKKRRPEGTKTNGTFESIVFGIIMKDVFRQSIGICPVLTKSL